MDASLNECVPFVTRRIIGPEASPPPRIPLAPGAAQGFEGVEDAGQAFFPGAFAFEGGLNSGQGQGGRAGSEQLGDGAHLLGQGGRPRLGGFGGCGGAAGGLPGVGLGPWRLGNGLWGRIDAEISLYPA